MPGLSQVKRYELGEPPPVEGRGPSGAGLEDFGPLKDIPGLSWRRYDLRAAAQAGDLAPVVAEGGALHLLWSKVAPVDRPRLEQRLAAVLGEGGSFDEVFQVVLPSGVLGASREVGRVVRDQSGQVCELRTLSVDLTSWVRAVEEARAACREKSDFLANMSHEIRTPLAAIVGFAEILADRDLASFDEGHFLQIIRRNGEHLSRLIDNVLDLSKVEAGRMEIEKIPVNLLQIVQEVLESLGCQARAKGIELVCEQASPLPDRVLTDMTRLKQILINLVGNGIKFTERGSVRVQVSGTSMPIEDSVLWNFEIRVHDTGIGFTEEQRPRVFQAFLQADLAIARKYGGSGLGLGLSQRLARLLGGDIELEDSQPGRGSIFRISFQAYEADPEPQSKGSRFADYGGAPS